MTAAIGVGAPRYRAADVVVSAPEGRPGNWAGAASCVLVDGHLLAGLPLAPSA